MRLNSSDCNPCQASNIPCAIMLSCKPGSIEVALFAADDPFTAGDCIAFEDDNVDVLAFVDACISRL